MGIRLLEEEAVRRLTQPIGVVAYHELGRMNAIPERTELLSGIVVEKMPKDPIHAHVVYRLVENLRALLPPHMQVRQENPLTLSNSEPEPDIAVVDNRAYREAHPGDAYLVIEVANTTLELDRAKRHIYAAAGIPEYWIVNLRDRTVEIYRRPTSEEYQDREILESTALIEFSGTPFTMRLNDLLAE